MSLTRWYRRLGRASVKVVREQLDTRSSWPQLESLIALYRKIDGLPTIPSTRLWAMSPDSLLLISEYIEKLRPRTIVECGSGSSTVTMALMLRRLGTDGKVISIENDADICAAVNERLAQDELSPWAVACHAPLVEKRYPGWDQVFRWYDLSRVPVPEAIDLLVVDGPHAKTCSNARYPAGPELLSRLSNGAVVFLDDADRPEEGRLPNLWQAHGGTVKWEKARAEKGALVGTVTSQAR